MPISQKERKSPNPESAANEQNSFYHPPPKLSPLSKSIGLGVTPLQDDLTKTKGTENWLKSDDPFIKSWIKRKNRETRQEKREKVGQTSFLFLYIYTQMIVILYCSTL